MPFLDALAETPASLALLIAALALLLLAALVLAWSARVETTRAQDAEATAAILTGVLETARDGYFGWFVGGPEGGVCSRRLAVLLGLPNGIGSDFEALRRAFGEEGERLGAAVQRLRETGRGFAIELGHADSARRLAVEGIRSVDDKGLFLADVLWVTEISELHERVQALATRGEVLEGEKARLGSTLAALPLPAWIRDEDLSLIWCNEAYARVVGADDTLRALSRPLAEGNENRVLRAIAARARAAETPRGGRVWTVIGGSRRLLDVIEAPFDDSGRRLTVGLAADITAQAELEAELETVRGANDQVLERLSTAIAVFGPDTRLGFHNRAFRELWGLEEEWTAERPPYGGFLETLRDLRRLPEVPDFPAFKAQELDRFRALLEPMEDLIHQPDGKTLHRVLAPHPEGGLIALYEDVTDSLALERSYNTLLASQTQTLDQLREAVAVFGADGRLRLANSAFQQLLPPGAAKLAEGLDLDAVAERLPKALGRGEPFTLLRARHGRGGTPPSGPRDGLLALSEARELEYSVAPLRDGGTALCFRDNVAGSVARAERAHTRALAALRGEHASVLSSLGQTFGPALEEWASGLELLAAEQKDGKGRGPRLAAMSTRARELSDLALDLVRIGRLEAGITGTPAAPRDAGAVLGAALTRARDWLGYEIEDMVLETGEVSGTLALDAAIAESLLAHLIAMAMDRAAPRGGLAVALGQAEDGGLAVTFQVRNTAAPREPPVFLLRLQIARRLAEACGIALEAGPTANGWRAICRLPVGRAEAA